MRKISLICVILSILCVLNIVAMPVSAAEADMSVTNGCHSADAAIPLSDEGKLAKTAKAVVLYELNSDTMIYAWNPDERIYPTSMVKMMTALVTLENAALTDEVTVTRTALNAVAIGSVSAGLVVGEVLTVEDLLYCMMVGSANDASTVLAEHVAGDQAAFVQMMNEKAAQLGCAGTAYTNAHGLHDEGTYTTARDLCRITEAALENEVFKTLFTTATHTVPATNKSAERIVNTTNYMMKDSDHKKYPDDRVTGGKTGATNQGGRCLTLTAEGNGMNVLCIVMGAKPTVAEDGSLTAYGSFEESKALLDVVFEKFEYRQIFFGGQSISQYPVAGGASDVVTQPADSASTVLPLELDRTALRWDYQQTVGAISAPVKQGSELGTVQVWYGTKCLAQTQMVAMHDVPVKEAPVVPERPAGANGGGIIGILLTAAGIVAGVLVAAILVLFAIRYTKILLRTMRRRNKRRRR